MSDERGPDPQEMSARDRALAAEIDRLLRDEAEIFAAVRVQGDVAYLDGLIESAEQRDAATDLALGVDGIARVQNDLEIEEFGLPGEATQSDEQVHGDASYRMLEGDREANPDPLREQTEIDFNDPVPVIGGDMTSDASIAAEEGIPYVPPTDPVVRPSRDAQMLEIVGDSAPRRTRSSRTWRRPPRSAMRRPATRICGKKCWRRCVPMRRPPI